MKMSKTLRTWRKANRALTREISRRHYRRNRKKLLARNKAWRTANQAYLKRWRKQNAERMAAASRLHEYGMTQPQFENLKKKQKNRCGICKRRLVSPHVDHNHKTGAVRGLLCRACNSGLGFLHDNVRIIRRAIKYLTQHGKDNGR